MIHEQLPPKQGGAQPSDDSTTGTGSRITSTSSSSSGDVVEAVEVTKDRHHDVLHSLATTDTTAAEEATKKKDELTFRKFCWNKLYCKYLGPIVMIAAAVAVVMVVLDIKPTRDDIPFADFIFSRDGWQGLEANELPKWPKPRRHGSGGQGQLLELEMINALDETWQPYFEQSINEWNNTDGAYYEGNRVLDLTVTPVRTPDSNCDFNRGKFVVCNGNYGDTTFHGVNEILVYDDTITASVAKLNEYYLATATEARKQYTMCHEIGHGFGLPHSDENFYNLNLGNCMDYTERPWTNTSPDQNTYQLLQEIYGSGDSGSDGIGSSTSNFAGEGTVISSESANNNNNNNGGRFLRGYDDDNANDDTSTFSAESIDGSNSGDESEEDSVDSVDSDSSDDNKKIPDVIPELIFQRASQAAYTLETKFADHDQSSSQPTEDWVQLHRDDYTASFQIELGDGFFLQAHFLLVPPN